MVVQRRGGGQRTSWRTRTRTRTTSKVGGTRGSRHNAVFRGPAAGNSDNTTHCGGSEEDPRNEDEDVCLGAKKPLWHTQNEFFFGVP